MPDVPAVSGMNAGGPRPAAAPTLDAVFAPGGRLAATLEDFEPRASQRDMAAAVAGVIADGGVLVAEAGTGTGKTLAYLIPAILSRKRVIVSTGTKNLQEQIFFKDLPILRDALGIPFKAVCMKGRGNYLCLHKLDEFRANPTFKLLDDRDYLPVIDEWAQRTETGDRAELEDLPDDLSFWNDLVGDERTLSGQRLRALSGLLRHPAPPAGGRSGRRHRQPPSALRGCGRQAEHLRRSHPGLPRRHRGRGAPARGSGDAVLRDLGEQLSSRRARARRRPRARRAAAPGFERGRASCVTTFIA